MRSVTLASAFAGLALIGASPSASAQDYNWHLYGSWQNFTVPLDHRIMQETVMKETLRKERGEGSVATPGQPLAEARLEFSPSLSRRKANLAAFVRKTRAVDPQGAAKLQALFGSRDIISDIDRELRAKAGLRTNDLAAAYAVWWMNAWQAAHGDFSDPDRATAQAVRQQAAAALSASPALGGAGDAAKQELAESLLVQAALVGSSAAEHSNDPAMLAKIRAAVRKGARGMGLDLDAMTLTPEGFRPAGRKVGALDEAARPSSQTAGSGVLMGAALAGLGFGGLWLVRGKKVGG